jgi:hypothetical protein
MLLKSFSVPGIMEFSFSKKMAFLYLPWYEPDIVATQ